MKNIIQNLDDITDSKEMLEIKPSLFTTVFVYILIVFLIGTFIWTYFGEIDIVVKANGVVRPSESIVAIKNKAQGTIQEKNIEDGKKVSKGEILYTINYDELSVEKELIESQIADINLKKINLDKFRKSIELGKNLFSKEDKNEIDYYFKYMKYDIDYNGMKLQNEKSSIEINDSKKNNNIMLDNIEFKDKEINEYINGLNVLKKSIMKDKSLFSKEQSIYEQQFLDYKAKLQQYQNEVMQKSISLNDVADKKGQNKNVLKRELENAKIELENLKLQLENYKTKYIGDIHSTINNNKSVLEELKYSNSSGIKEDRLRKELYYINILKESIKERKNKFTNEKDDEDVRKDYLGMYNKYKQEVSKLENIKFQKSRELEPINSKIKYSTNKLRDYENELNIKKKELDLEKLNNNQEAILKINEEISIIQNNISAENTNIENLNKQLDKNLYDLSLDDNEVKAFKDTYMKNLNTNIANIEESLEVIETELSLKKTKESNFKQTNGNLIKLEESIRLIKNLFPKENLEYYNKFEQYQLNIKNSINEIELKEKSINGMEEKLEYFDANIENQIKESKISLKNSENILDNFKNTYLMDINNKLEESQIQIHDNKSNIEKYKNNDGIYSTTENLNKSHIEKFKIDSLVAIDEAISAIDDELVALEKRLKSIEIQIEESIVKSPVDGIINVVREINNSELLEVGAEIATIISEEKDSYKIELFVSNKDIAKLKKNNEIKYNFHALPYREYGYLSGKITTIGVDSKVDRSSGMSYYSVESYMKNVPVYSYKGNEGEIKIGMTCEAQVITERKKILYFLLEKINIKD